MIAMIITVVTVSAGGDNNDECDDRSGGDGSHLLNSHEAQESAHVSVD
jgi:hypothetical protein